MSPTSGTNIDKPNPPRLYNQCIFLRRSMIKRRIIKHKLILKAAVGPHNLDDPDDDPDNKSTVADHSSSSDEMSIIIDSQPVHHFTRFF